MNATFGQGDSHIETTQRSSHGLLGGALDGYESVHNQSLAEWLDGHQDYPMNEDGPIIPDRENPIHEYIESTMRKDRDDIQMKSTLNDEDIMALLKDANATEEQKQQLVELLKEYKILLAPAFSENQPAGSSFFIPHTIKLTHDNPVWTPQF
jgi:hypothetical protein